MGLMRGQVNNERMMTLISSDCNMLKCSIECCWLSQNTEI